MSNPIEEFFEWFSSLFDDDDAPADPAASPPDVPVSIVTAPDPADAVGTASALLAMGTSRAPSPAKRATPDPVRATTRPTLPRQTPDAESVRITIKDPNVEISWGSTYNGSRVDEYWDEGDDLDWDEARSFMDGWWRAQGYSGTPDYWYQIQVNGKDRVRVHRGRSADITVKRGDKIQLLFRPCRTVSARMPRGQWKMKRTGPKEDSNATMFAAWIQGKWTGEAVDIWLQYDGEHESGTVQQEVIFVGQDEIKFKPRDKIYLPSWKYVTWGTGGPPAAWISKMLGKFFS